TALVATMGEANYFKSGREFAAFVGLVPRQSGTGGKIKLLGKSQKGRHIFTHPVDTWRQSSHVQRQR
ncbi:Transposase IS116/IS110/IS902 family protein, partial [Nitrosomonas sp. Nm58]